MVNAMIDAQVSQNHAVLINLNSSNMRTVHHKDEIDYDFGMEI